MGRLEGEGWGNGARKVSKAYYCGGVIQTWRRGSLLVRQSATRVSFRRNRRSWWRRRRRRRSAPSPTGRLAAALADPAVRSPGCHGRILTLIIFTDFGPFLPPRTWYHGQEDQPRATGPSARRGELGMRGFP